MQRFETSHDYYDYTHLNVARQGKKNAELQKIVYNVSTNVYSLFPKELYESYISFLPYT